MEQNENRVIYLAGGCFWGMEKLMQSIPGVLDAESGYANGTGEHDADYKTVCTGKTGFREISWDDLIPADWNPEKFLADLELDDLQDNDPRAMELMQRMREEWDRAPVVERFSGQQVRIPGFVVPLESDGRTIREFLLVPYFGACVHVPPRPPTSSFTSSPTSPSQPA